MTPNYTLTLPTGHTLSLATTAGDIPPDQPQGSGMGVGMACSRLWVRLDDGPWTRSRVASMHKVLVRFMDLSAAEIPGAWEEVTGERLDWHMCDCGHRGPDVRVVDGSDEWWCVNCRRSE